MEVPGDPVTAVLDFLWELHVVDRTYGPVCGCGDAVRELIRCACRAIWL
ncbi:hypothetical protein AS9A_3281 [Hoyosella subflava DQS3-9A1]|uniref:Uncharacterized protein n=1 Tax=Hoyosella subflava (strain DSM 45089 / JCM 17490 / NBRC 109087 / DQS3-9A1) TaxID=443218 RepID=F6EP63_HOYSD|nr:hypothetical protein AS9A_3281 [Hoyosella subflava DQS3-9A1]